MAWKQPIPTNLDEDFGEDHFSNLLYRELIYRACNKDGFFTDKKGRSIALKRGQVVFGRRAFHTYLGRETNDNGKKVERSLHKLCDFYQKLTLEVTQHSFTIVTLLNYDNLVSFDPDFDPVVTQQRPSSDPVVTTSKSVKHVKTGNVEAPAPEPLPEVSSEAGFTEWVAELNRIQGSQFHALPALEKNYRYWKQQYGQEKMLEALAAIPYNSWLKDKSEPVLLLRTKDKSGEPVDRIGELLNTKKPTTTVTF